MKKSSNIITHLKNQPLYNKLKTVKCFEKIRSLLPPRLSNAILFIYIKNDTLFFVLNHPGYKMEFNYNLNLIKRVLKELKKREVACKDLVFRNIKTFVSNKIDFKEKKNEAEEKLTYNERAAGDFEIKTDNPNLKKIFQNIKTIIRDVHKDYGR